MSVLDFQFPNSLLRTAEFESLKELSRRQGHLVRQPADKVAKLAEELKEFISASSLRLGVFA